MPYALGEKSRKELDGVHPRLVAVVERAIEVTDQDFSVHDGLRTQAEQAVYVRRGVSRTMRSKHLPQPDGYGHAVDLVPYINGKLRWEWEPIYIIADAVRKAARELRVRVLWGGCWSELTDNLKPVHILVDDYVRLRKGIGKTAFVDGPHFEIIV